MIRTLQQKKTRRSSSEVTPSSQGEREREKWRERRNFVLWALKKILMVGCRYRWLLVLLTNALRGRNLSMKRQTDRQTGIDRHRYRQVQFFKPVSNFSCFDIEEEEIERGASSFSSLSPCSHTTSAILIIFMFFSFVFFVFFFFSTLQGVLSSMYSGGVKIDHNRVNILFAN